MSDGRRFKGWGSNAQGNNRVITREYGCIPGILKARDIHISIPIHLMERKTGLRAAQFCAMIGSWRSGRDVNGMPYGHREFVNDRFHTTDVKLSAIANPFEPYNRDW